VEPANPDEQNADPAATREAQEQTKPKKVGSLALFCRKVICKTLFLTLHSVFRLWELSSFVYKFILSKRKYLECVRCKRDVITRSPKEEFVKGHSAKLW